jgi:hypothetical protein
MANRKCVLNGSWEGIMLGSQLAETQSPLTLLCQWIITAWQQISEKVSFKVFKKLFISNAVDSILWNDSKGVGNSSSNNKEFCVLHTQSNTTIFYLVVQ